MKKTRFIALFITAAMITTSAVSIPAYAQETTTSSSSVGNTTGEWENKLGDPVYAEVLRSADESKKFAVTVGITNTLDPQAIEQEAIRITGIDIEEFDTISESDYNAFCSMQRQLTEEFYLNENSKILSKLAVADEDVVTIDTHSASLTLNLTKSEIERIAAFNDVKTINLDISEEDMPVYEDTSPYNRKIDRDSLVPLLEKAEEGEKFTVWVWVVDRAKDEAICAEVRSRMIADGSWENHTNPEYDNWDDTSKMISDSRRLQDEVYKQENPKIAAALELADEDIIEIGTQAPLFTLNLTKSEIERIAENAYVTHIDYIDLHARGDKDEAPETLDEAKRDISETTVFLNNVEDTSKYGGLEITEIAMTYTGSPVTLNIVVKDGDKTLEENVDYTAEYSNNIETGAANLDIIGIGGYKGKRSYHFAIMNEDMFGKQGDTDGDGEITSNDALILLRGSIDNKKFSESEMALCDMDKDGIITSNDALLVLRKSVGHSE